MFCLTRQERQVVIFLLSIALLGMGISFFTKRYSPIKVGVSFDANIEKVNLNRADKESLIDAPGIGEKLAQRIIEYRNKNGYFKDIEELKNITGINDYKYEKLKELFYIER